MVYTTTVKLAAILVGGEITDWFRIESSVRQGCVWSPLLFGIMIDCVLRKSCDRPSAGLCMRECRRTLFGIEQTWHLTNLDYTDDVTLLESGSKRGQQAFMHCSGLERELVSLSRNLRPRPWGLGKQSQLLI